MPFWNPRDFTHNIHKRVDDRPYGGGPGMVMTALPIIRAIEKSLNVGHRKSYIKKPVIIWFSPSGKQFTNKDADKLSKYDDVVLVCGRYEGIDERAKKMLKTIATVKEFAVGEAVYTGGEVPSLAIVDAVTRRLPGVLGKDASVEERRIASSAVYTRPETIEYKKKKYKVPKVLQTGHHANIDAWRKKK
jgi:tRNA (guanine37-N1)-methyltransferase